MHELSLALAALPAPSRIFGLPMRPYSLGHELFLIREQNPIISGGSANVTRTDLAAAVLICSSTFEECRRISSRWSTRLGVWAWNRRVRKMNHLPHVQAFREYRADGKRDFPEGRRVAGEGGGGIAGAPFLKRLHQFLVLEYRINHLEAWDFPYGLAQMEFATYWEGKGCFSIFSQLDAIQNEALEKLDAEEAAAKGN